VGIECDKKMKAMVVKTTARRHNCSSINRLGEMVIRGTREYDFIHLAARNRLRGLRDQRFPARLLRKVMLRDQFHLHIWQRFRPYQGINK
jgi:hypothetical protein